MMLFSLFVKSAPVQVRLARRNQVPFLLARFERSTPPLVWQMDLEKADNVVFSLREKDGEWELGLTMQGQAFSPVAHFDERGDAQDAFFALQRAVLRNAPPVRCATWGRFLLWMLFGAFVLVAALAFVSRPASKEMAEATGKAALSAQTSPASPFTPEGDVRSGVPLSADEVLSRFAP